MIKLLLVDDEYALLSGLKQYIPWKSIGVDEVLAEVDSCVALEVAVTQKPNIIITDINMPRMNGIELATAVRKLLPDCDIIFLTAHSEKEYWKKAIMLRTANFLEKPVDKEELLDAVAALVTKIKTATNEEGELRQKRKEYMVQHLSRASTPEEKKQSLDNVKQVVVSEVVQKIKDVVNENYMNTDLSLDMISRRVYLSHQYICKLFKQYTDQTVNTYIISVRIDKAKCLLENQGIRVSEVARMVGYASPNHFAKLFCAQVGVNPSVYRKMINLHSQL